MSLNKSSWKQKIHEMIILNNFKQDLKAEIGYRLRTIMFNKNLII